MKCIIGLGNPGDQYKNTKHNFGYWVIDSYLKKNNLKWKLGKGDYVFVDKEDFILAKTTSFMNNSGHPVKNIVDYFSIQQLDELVIVYDDIDLPLGSVRFRLGGSGGGHRGLDSIIYHLNNQDFVKLKLGIATNLNMRPSEEYVLKPFPVKYNDDIKLAVNIACDGLDFFLKNTINETMNQFNRRIKGES